MAIDFSAQRMSYEKDELLEHNIPDTPLPLLQKWLQESIHHGVPEPYAMSLATCGADGMPAVRIVLMRQIHPMDDGRLSLVFYTNYQSQKGKQLAENPNAQALFFWHAMERQVRLSGRVHKLDEAQSIQYYQSRPKDSQIAAWVSNPQSGVVSDRAAIEQQFAALQQRYTQDVAVPKPDFWGGYVLCVDKVEFWQGRANRMHDRILYQFLSDTRCWQQQRLLP